MVLCVVEVQLHRTGVGHGDVAVARRTCRAVGIVVGGGSRGTYLGGLVVGARFHDPTESPTATGVSLAAGLLLYPRQ